MGRLPRSKLNLPQLNNQACVRGNLPLLSIPVGPLGAGGLVSVKTMRERSLLAKAYGDSSTLFGFQLQLTLL